MEEKSTQNQKKMSIKNFNIKKFNIKKIDIKKYLTVQNFLKLIAFVVLFYFYIKSEMTSRVVSRSKEILTIGSHEFPYTSLVGVFTAIMTIILISFVLFYKDFGFVVSMIILIRRTIRLFANLSASHYHSNILPALFTTLAALVSVILIYLQYKIRQRTEAKHRKEVEDYTKEVMGAFTSCIDGKDSYTNGHSKRVAKYTTMLAARLGESRETVSKYYNIALLHDIGKIGIPDAILTKPGKLTPEEYAIMKSHAARGYEILKDVKMADDIAAGAHHHHERFDGKGYPNGLAGKDIPWVARIISVADAFDAMSSNRPYREKLSLEYIAEEIENCAGTQFDPTVVQAFLSLYVEGAFKDLA